MVVVVSIYPAASLCLSSSISLLLCLATILKFLPRCLSTSSSSFCDETCGSLHIPYPFGITPGCGFPEFNLTCTNNSELFVKIKSSSYPLLNFTSSSIFIDPGNFTSCHFGADFSLLEYHPNETYTLSSHNYLILNSCKSPMNSTSCWVANVTTASCSMEVSGCYNLSSFPNLSWVYEKISSWNCSSFNSVQVTALDNSSSQATFHVNFGLELEWGLPGGCENSNCSENANCTEREGKHVCQCKTGSYGDPYRPFGCHQEEICNTLTNPWGCYDGAELNKTGSSSLKSVTPKALIIAGIIAGSTVLSALVLASAVIKRRINFHAHDRRSQSNIREITQMLTLKGTTTRHVKTFAYKDLEKATKGFSPGVVLGNGAHGTVYAGKLSDGQTVAVKRINSISKKSIELVINELIILSAVKHKNLVQLLGCCLEVYDPILVYEFMPNGTLFQHLQRERGDGLDWYTRISIASEAAEALAYLHSSVDPPIYHRDVKSSNILLDYQYTTKVGDFGLSKLVLTEGSHISTVPQGTPGYLDPNYHQNFQLSDKSDVYSFGVVLIEIITAMKVVDFDRDSLEINLAALALSRIVNGSVNEIIDPFLEVHEQPFILAMVQSVAELAFRCLSYDKDARPTMVEVAKALQDIKLLSISSLGEDQSPPRAIDSFTFPRHSA